MLVLSCAHALPSRGERAWLTTGVLPIRKQRIGFTACKGPGAEREADAAAPTKYTSSCVARAARRTAMPQRWDISAGQRMRRPQDKPPGERMGVVFFVLSLLQSSRFE